MDIQRSSLPRGMSSSASIQASATVMGLLAPRLSRSGPSSSVASPSPSSTLSTSPIYHGTGEGQVGPLEAHLDSLSYKGLVFGRFGETSGHTKGARGCSSGWQLATVAASAPLRRSPSSATAISSTGLPSTQARRSRGSSSPACALLTPTAAPRGARSASFATSGPSSGTPHSVLRTQTSPTPPSSVALGPRLMASGGRWLRLLTCSTVRVRVL